MRNVSVDGYKRINKVAARNVYGNGGKVTIVPCNMRPGSVWYADCNFEKPCDVDETTAKNLFDRVVNDYGYYNCNSESGMYCAFYVKEE